MSSSTIVGTVGLSLGSQAVDFNLKSVDGKNYRLGDFANKNAIVIVFSCNHCPYVQAYEDRMIKLQHEYASKSVALIAINSNYDHDYPEDSYEKMIERSREKGFNFQYLRDETQDIAHKYGAICTPHIFAFDKQRTLRYKGRIDDNRNPAEVKTHDLSNALDAILEGNSPSVQETKPFGCSIKWKH